MTTEAISLERMIAAYMLLGIPLAVLLWYRVALVGKMLAAAARMTVQLLFVGFYLQVVFEKNNAWLNGVWLIAMVAVADVSIVRHCDLRLRRFAAPMFGALAAGTAVPLLFFIAVILKGPGLMDAQYVIPIGGMILGNCLRADVIGLAGFYQAIRKNEKPFLLSLAQAATLKEAIRPYLRDAFRAALLPTITTMSTIGLVSLPGMMTGVILAGADPVTAIKYQIAIMIAIFTGTCITVLLAILLSIKTSFSGYGVLDRSIFAGK
ncbi:MAG: ABC transporter permease [Phycisphaerae bacterium]|nr:ABC transporter permease [Phycisphaerae bacterium]